MEIKAEYINHMGDDLEVANAARVSFDKESKWVETCSCGVAREGNRFPGCGADIRTCPNNITKTLSEADTKLIKYLAKHNHWTPFGHTSIKLRMSAPVPIRTQCFKHKQGFVENEESRRYVSSRPEYFMPDFFRKRPEGSIKQGSGEKHERSDKWLTAYEMSCINAIRLYEEMIEDGVCPEQARFVLPQGCIVNWIWTGSLYAYANFYLKRSDSHAQKEIQDLAEEVSKIIQPLFPVSWAALVMEG